MLATFIFHSLIFSFLYHSNFGYIFTTDCTDYTDFSSQEATMADAEQSEWQEPPRLKNPYNPCNPLWKNTSET